MTDGQSEKLEGYNKQLKIRRGSMQVKNITTGMKNTRGD